MKNSRVHVIDLARGVIFISMLVYHAMFDVVFEFGVDFPWFRGGGGRAWQLAISAGLIFISGISSSLSRDNIRRGARVFACGLLITLATILLELFGIHEYIWFGILHFVGAAYILLGLLRERVLDKINPAVGAFASLALYLLAFGVPSGYLGVGGLRLVSLPSALYGFSGLEWLGFSGKSFFSADYFPLLPNLFLFLCGYYFWRLVGGTKAAQKLGSLRIAPINALGRHTLLVYMLHQPVIYAVLWAIFALGAR